MVRKQFGALAACALIAIASASASASVITFDGFGHSLEINVHHAAQNQNEFAGEMHITIDAVPFIAYCVDMDAGAPPVWAGTTQPVSIINGGIQIAYLYDHFFAGVTTDTQAAALQAAIWEVVDDYPGALSLTAGNFRVNGAGTQANNVRTQGAAYLAAIPADLSSYVPQSYIVFSDLGNDGLPLGQNLIVPEPASITALLLGAGLLLRRRPARR